MDQRLEVAEASLVVEQQIADERNTAASGDVERQLRLDRGRGLRTRRTLEVDVVLR